MKKLPIPTLVLVLLVVALAITAGALGHRVSVLDGKLEKRMAELAALWNPNHNVPDADVVKNDQIENASRADEIDISSMADVIELRARVSALVFGADGPQAKRLSVAPRDPASLLKEARYSRIAPLADTEQIVFEMPMGLRAVVLHHTPKRERVNKVMLYHKGHGTDYAGRFELMQALLQAGWDVVELAMPVINENQQVVVLDTPHHGPIQVTRHDDFWFVDLPQGSPLRYYIEPTLGMIDYLTARSPGIAIHAAGLSGGGWSATLAGVLDERITTVTSIAGSWPFYLVTTRMKINGDYELLNPDLYRIASPLELFTLAAIGTKRTYLQVFNVNDSCCFAGHSSESFKDAVAGKVRDMGQGHYEQLLDESAVGHSMGPTTLQRMLQMLSVP